MASQRVVWAWEPGLWASCACASTCARGPCGWWADLRSSSRNPSDDCFSFLIPKLVIFSGIGRLKSESTSCWRNPALRHERQLIRVYTGFHVHTCYLFFDSIWMSKSPHLIRMAMISLEQMLSGVYKSACIWGYLHCTRKELSLSSEFLLGNVFYLFKGNPWCRECPCTPWLDSFPWDLTSYNWGIKGGKADGLFLTPVSNSYPGSQCN